MPANLAHLTDPATNPSPGVGLRIEALSKNYGERQVINDLDLRIDAGEFVALVGHSGCGKSTLLRLIAGLEHADGGRIDIDTGPRASDNADVRMMFQDSRLLPWRSVLANVAIGLSDKDIPGAEHVLEKVGLAERRHDWPAKLSGGQRQRVALARALVHQPRLMLLDEPLGALDALTRIEMQGLIETLWRDNGFTALLVTHDVQEAVALADRVILIENGGVALDHRINLPRPRARGSAAFAAIEERILRHVMRLPSIESQLPLGDLSLVTSIAQVRWAT